jgi:hypothetical protein
MADTVLRAGIHGAGRNVLNRALNARQSFVTSGSLKGEHGSVGTFRFRGEGQLKHGERNQWIADREHATYVVTSYSTPIAWVVPDETDRGRVYVVSQRFSTTTSKHQGAMWPLSQDANYFG